MITLSRCVRQRLSSLRVLSTPRAQQQQRGLSASASNPPGSNKNKTEVPVASYTRTTRQPGANANAAAERTTLAVDDGSQRAPTPVAGHGVDRKAVAFDGSIVPKMTPTMKGFTLEGKVAVVTG